MAKTLESEHHGHELCSTTDRDTGTFCVSSLRVRLKPQKPPERPQSPDFLKDQYPYSLPILSHKRVEHKPQSSLEWDTPKS